MSNGSLMRVTPAAVFTAKLSAENAKEIILVDTSLTHPNPQVHDCIVNYCHTIHYLLNNPN